MYTNLVINYYRFKKWLTVDFENQNGHVKHFHAAEIQFVDQLSVRSFIYRYSIEFLPNSDRVMKNETFPYTEPLMECPLCWKLRFDRSQTSAPTPSSTIKAKQTVSSIQQLMLMTDFGDEISWWQLWDNNSCHQHPTKGHQHKLVKYSWKSVTNVHVSIQTVSVKYESGTMIRD